MILSPLPPSSVLILEHPPSLLSSISTRSSSTEEITAFLPCTDIVRAIPYSCPSFPSSATPRPFFHQNPAHTPQLPPSPTAHSQPTSPLHNSIVKGHTGLRMPASRRKLEELYDRCFDAIDESVKRLANTRLPVYDFMRPEFWKPGRFMFDFKAEYARAEQNRRNEREARGGQDDAVTGSNELEKAVENACRLHPLVARKSDNPQPMMVGTGEASVHFLDLLMSPGFLQALVCIPSQLIGYPDPRANGDCPSVEPSHCLRHWAYASAASSDRAQTMAGRRRHQASAIDRVHVQGSLTLR
jgi:hypothetical protein